jgi:hypothetical protein
VTLEQATAIEAARLQGDLSALLRNRGDLERASTSAAPRTSLGMAPPPAAVKQNTPVKSQPPIELIVGAERVTP